MRKSLLGGRTEFISTAALLVGAALIYGLLGWASLSIASPPTTLDTLPLWLPSGFAVVFVFRKGLITALAFLIPAWILALQTNIAPLHAVFMALSLTLEPLARETLGSGLAFCPTFSGRCKRQDLTPDT